MLAEIKKSAFVIARAESGTYEWLLTDINQIDGSLKLMLPDIVLSVNDIYERVDFS